MPGPLSCAWRPAARPPRTCPSSSLSKAKRLSFLAALSTFFEEVVFFFLFCFDSLPLALSFPADFLVGFCLLAFFFFLLEEDSSEELSPLSPPSSELLDSSSISSSSSSFSSSSSSLDSSEGVFALGLRLLVLAHFGDHGIQERCLELVRVTGGDPFLHGPSFYR